VAAPSRTGRAPRARRAESAPRAARPPSPDGGLWRCPECSRTFRQQNQAHSCGTGSRAALLAGRDTGLVALYERLERLVRSLPGTEIVMRGRCALFRTTRIFADLVFMTDALRLAVLLPREVNDPMFLKTGRMSAHRFAAVVLVRTAAQLRAAAPFVREAHAFARGEEAGRTPPRRRARR
jgi:hypothetical protein